MSELMDRLCYVDLLAPEHCRYSCNDNNLNNAAIDANDLQGFGRCYRCTLLRVADKGITELTDD